MHIRILAFALLASIFTVSSAMAQSHPLRGPEPSGGVSEPDQPVQPQIPTLVHAPQQPAAPPQQPQPPFTLTAQEEAQVDRVLNQWEERNRTIKTFNCQFKRWVYDVVFGSADQPKFVDTGVIKFESPDRGMIRADMTEKNGEMVPIEDNRAEHWISDGKSIFEFNHTKKQLVEHKLPPELQGKAIANTPLPFLFGAEAQKLKQRYYIRLVTPADVKDQIWLDAFPRFQQDAANFHHAQFIISTQGMSPFALKLIQPNEKDYMVYQFYDVVVNDPLRLFKGDPFRAYTPLGWQKIVEEPPAPAQASRPASDGQR
jgi:TIGR03009 family protein